MPSAEQLRRLLEREPSDPFLLYALAQELAKAGDWPGAIEQFDRCLEADPQYLYAYYHKAKTLHAAGHQSQALAAARAGLAAARGARDSHAQAELEALLEDVS